MPLSLTCSCGAKLEIDDKFAGKVIPCPDCHRELSTMAKVVQADRISAFALAGVLLALIGAFSVIGPVLAMICGGIGLRQIARHPEKVAGKRYAWASIILGGLFTALGVAGHLSPEILGIDGPFRELEWAKKLEHQSGELEFNNKDSNSVPVKFAITRPSRAWGVLRSTNSFQRTSEDLILMAPWQDAQVACMNDVDTRGPNPDEDDLLDEALEYLLKSELVQVVGRYPKTLPKLTVEQGRDKKKLESPKGTVAVELLIDLKLAGIERTVLLRAMRSDDRLGKMNVLAAVTRKSRFRRLEPELRKILDSYTIQH